MNQRLWQFLDEDVDDDNTADVSSEFLYVDILKTFDFENEVDGYVVVNVFRKGGALDEYAVGVAVIVSGHFELCQILFILPFIDCLCVLFEESHMDVTQDMSNNIYSHYAI